MSANSECDITPIVAGRQYPLVVKLVTIDGASRSADVYSYAQDMEVVDPMLDAHLKHWALDWSARC